MLTSDLMRHPERYEHRPTCDYPRDRQQPCTCFLTAENDPQTAPSSRGTGVRRPGEDGRNAPTARPPLGAHSDQDREGRGPDSREPERGRGSETAQTPGRVADHGSAPPFAQPVFTDGTPVPPTCCCGKLKAIDVGQVGQITLRGQVHRLGAPCYWNQP